MTLTANEFVELICAVHLSAFVEGPFTEHGGLMVVGPPGMLKSTFIEVLDKQYHDAVMLSDVNVQMLTQLRDAIANRNITTLVLPELAKLFERHANTAANVEGTLRAMAGEGFTAASFEDARINRLRARATIIGAMTPSTQAAHFKQWEESGFNRRFIWSLIRLSDPNILDQAVVEWRLVNFQVKHVPRHPVGSEMIPNRTLREERVQLRNLVKYQPGGSHSLQLQLLTKMLAVLRYWYDSVGDTRDPMQTMLNFAPALGREGVEISFKTKPSRANVSKEAASLLAHRRWNKVKRKHHKRRKRHGRR